MGEPHVLTDEVTFRVAGHPITQGSKRAFVVGGQARLVESAGQRHKDWRHAVGDAARLAYADRPPMTGPIEITATFELQPPKSKPKRRRTWPTGQRSGDLSKLMRCIEDSLTGVVYIDDSQIVRYRDITKDWAGPAGPGVTITITPIDHDQPLLHPVVVDVPTGELL